MLYFWSYLSLSCHSLPCSYSLPITLLSSKHCCQCVKTHVNSVFQTEQERERESKRDRMLAPNQIKTFIKEKRRCAKNEWGHIPTACRLPKAKMYYFTWKSEIPPGVSDKEACCCEGNGIFKVFRKKTKKTEQIAFKNKQYFQLMP